MSKASMTPGELYINRDRDFKTGEWRPYVKIGIVRALALHIQGKEGLVAKHPAYVHSSYILR